MEPPKLSALQASPSLLHIGGSTPGKQQGAIYTASKPMQQTQTSASSKVQVSQSAQKTSKKPKHSLQQIHKPQHLVRDHLGKFVSSPAKNLHQHILKKQSLMKQTSNTSSPLHSPGLPQQVSPVPYSSDQARVIGPVTNQAETTHVKNLLAKKIRTQTPVPIAPKGSQNQPQAQQQPTQQPPSIETGGNPMHLVTFTTQQSMVIQGQLHQSLSPQPYVGVASQQMGINSQQPYHAQNCVSAPQPCVNNPQGYINNQAYGSPAVGRSNDQIHGIQSVVDGTQQYVISHQSDDGTFGSCVNSSQSSHRSRSPKSDKSKKKSSSQSRSGSRSSSPKGSSPKRQSSASSRSSSPRSASPKNYELEVCGEVERAKDVVQVGLEARIERVENRCLNQIKQMNKSITVVPMPSTSHPISSSITPSSQNIILPIIVGSTNTGQTGNFIPSPSLSCPTIVNPSTQPPVLIQQNIQTSSPVNTVMPVKTSNPEAQSIEPKSNDECSTPVSNQSFDSELKDVPVNDSQPSVVKQDSLSEESVVENQTNQQTSAEVEPSKPKVKYVCSQDETEAAVSSLLINSEEETRQSISNGSEGDLGLSSAVVHAADETEAAISALTGMLEEDNVDDTEDIEDDAIMMDTEMVSNGGEDHFVQGEDQIESEENVQSGETVMAEDGNLGCVEADKTAVNGGESEMSDMCTKQAEIMLNGVLASPGESDIIPSPTADECHINGLENSDSEEFGNKDTLKKLASEKLAKINGITHHIGNGDFDKKTVEGSVTGDSVIEADKNVNQIIAAGDAVRVNGCEEAEVAEEDSGNLFNGKIDNVMEVAGKEEGNPPAQCYELASESDVDMVADGDSDKVIIENEMCLQPAVSSVSNTEEEMVVDNNVEPKENKDVLESSGTVPQPEETVSEPVESINVLEKTCENGDSSEKENPEEITSEIEKKDENSEDSNCDLPDVSSGCVDILKAAIESEKIDELDLNGDSNDSLPVVTEGIYQTGIQMTMGNGHIPIGNEMTTTVGSNSISLIPNVFSSVQTGLVVGTIVSINNNILTTSNVPLPYVDNTNTAAKVSVNMEMCQNNRHLPTPETSRDSELSCDSIASSITDSLSDKHSISIQQPIFNVQSIQTSNFLSVQTIPGKQKVVTTSIITTGPSQTSPRSSKRPKKRNRNQSGSSDSRGSSACTTPPISQAAAQPPGPDLVCEWGGCKK